jgi:raffinose/stachyose/melibiose transport system permease protein
LYIFITLGIAMPINYVTLTKVMQATALINTVAGIIILYAATKIPFGVFLTYAFIESIPKEIDEAAIIDGCSPSALFFTIIFPLLTPAWVTTAILSFLDFWSEFILPLYFLQSSTKWPMTLAVYNFFGMFEARWNLVSADIVLTILPVIAVYLLGQRYIISGMTTGAVKG